MYRAVLILLFVARVKPQPKSYQQEYYISRQSRDNSAPLQTGYVISRMDNKPASFQSLANHPSAAASNTGVGTVKTHADIGTNLPVSSDSEQHSKSLLGKFTDMSVMHNRPPFKIISTVEEVFTGATDSMMPYVTKSWGKPSIDFEIAKAKSKYGIEPAISLQADKDYIMKDNVAKIERYSAASPTAEKIKSEYDFDRAFHIDDDDVKTLSGTTLEWWPFFLHSPYEYENMRMDSEIQKAKEKRYAMGSPERIIPVHERQEDYAHVYGARHFEPQYDRDELVRGAADNPISGDEGFISFVLSDLSNSYDSDPLELSWRTTAFDTNDNIRPNTGKRNRRLDNHNHITDQTNTAAKVDASRAVSGDSNHEKGYENKHEFDKHESGDKKSNNHDTDRTKSEAHQAAYKDVVDEFANRYGGEDHKRHSAFAYKRNSDNGEKKKGFRRVYHKDEYQEDNEYYDNTNNSAKAEDSGSSSANLGGSSAAVQSHAAAAAGNKANTFNEVENTRKNQFENNHKGHDAKKGLDRDYNRYKDVAKNTAHDDYAYFHIV